MSVIAETQYLNKSIRIFRFYTIASLILILVIMLLSPLRQNYPILVSALTLLPVLIPLILAPISAELFIQQMPSKQSTDKSEKSLRLRAHLPQIRHY